MVLAGRRVNLCVWWSIGWTVAATLTIMRFHLRAGPLVVGVLAGALVPRLLARCERFSRARRLLLAGCALGLLCSAAAAMDALPRPLMSYLTLSVPALLAGLVVQGPFDRAVPLMRRAIALLVVAASVLCAAQFAPPLRHPHRRPRNFRPLWSLVMLALAVTPPPSLRRRSQLDPVLPQ